MAFSAKLAELFVEFVTKGIEQFQKGLDVIKAKLGDIQKDANAVGEKADYAFKRAGGALLGWITYGTYASAVGEQFHFRIEQIGLAIAGLFRPEIEKVLNSLGRLVDWFYRLSDSQRDNIARWIQGAAAGLMVMTILPKIIAGIQTLIIGVKALTGALFGLNAASGGILPVVGALFNLVLGFGTAGLIASQGFGAVSGVLGPLQELFGELMETMRQLATEVAPLVAFVIQDLIIPAVKMLTHFLHQLNAGVYDSIIKWTAAIATFYLVIKVIPELIASIIALIAKLWTLITTQIIQKAMSGPKGWAELAAGAAIAAAAIGAAAGTYYLANKELDKMHSKLGQIAGGKPGARSSLAPSLGGFETVEAAYKRIAAASIGVGKSIPEEQLDVAEEQLKEQQKTNKKLDGMKPAFA